MNNKATQESLPSPFTAYTAYTAFSPPGTYSSAASSSTATPRESPKVPPGLGLEACLPPNITAPIIGEWTFQDDFDLREAKLKYLLLSGQWGIKEYEEERTDMFWELQFQGESDPEVNVLKGQKKGGKYVAVGRRGEGSGGSQPCVAVGK